MVDVLASDHRSDGVGLFCTGFTTGVLELEAFLLETGLDRFGIAMDVFTVLDRNHIVSVLLGQHLAVLYGLHRSVIMILVHFTIDGGLSLLMTVLAYFLVHNGGGNLLVDSGVMMSSLGPENFVS